MLSLKVGLMPGKLVEVAIEEGMTVGEIFEVAEVTISNHDIRLDGEKVELDKKVYSGNLLVATKQIKGNATIKVGLMPGKLSEIVYEEGMPVSDLFTYAGITVDNHDIRLDGEKVSMDTKVYSGSLLVATKQIKGNCDCACACEECECEVYRAEGLNLDEIEMLLGVPLPTEIEKDDIEIIDEDTLSIKTGLETYIVETSMFDSVYKIAKKEDEEYQEMMIEKVEELVSPYPKGAEENIKMLIEEITKQKERYSTWVEQCNCQLEVLRELQFRIGYNK